MDLSSNIDPKRGSFLTKAASARNKGTAKDQKIKDLGLAWELAKCLTPMLPKPVISSGSGLSFQWC